MRRKGECRSFSSVQCAIDVAHCRTPLPITSEGICMGNLFKNFVVLWTLLKTFLRKVHFVIIFSDFPKWSLRWGYNG
jgi:hypothetical protein